ncbi:carboxypeptidase-like regulatory domain-containing protein [Niabella ginsengisoli]|uniref:Carboxypeptidase-like regulatory domain-containing protein n=1 Tax=Niabella ginsengisoli TaxID=522298 RepID=A0ABS9SFT9_9BACT|nr:carboxypeptidase-like regulatory domain-containing protein [Niabella ginsengisoli]MCH5597236.1 carboxypeptidase-like regulatory domain-containing protein [Niabella ginsengisoli]
MQQTNNTYPFYGPEDIKRYLSGSMNAQEMHDMEKAALSDPLLADAIDGFRGFRNANAAIVDKHLNDIRAAILGTQEKENLVVPITKNNNSWWRWAAAACSLGIIASSIWWFTQKDQNGIGKSPVAVIETPTAEEQKPAPALQNSDSVETALTDIKKAGKIPTPLVAEQPVADLSKGKSKINAFSESKNSTVPVEAAAEVTPDAPLIAATNSEAQPAQQQDFNVSQQLMIRGDKAYARSKNELKAAITSQPPKMIYGKVTDKRGIPVPSATIAFSPNKGTVTNSDGSFALPADDSSVKATISMVSYQQTVATLTPGKSNNITLSKMDQDLNETVVVGYGQQKRKGKLGDFQKFKAKTEAPNEEVIYPEEGWSDFYQELGSNLGVDKSKATKTLQIKFTVDENGDPVDFTIVESPDEILTKKAIEFIKKSKWKNFKLDKKALVKIEVN